MSEHRTDEQQMSTADVAYGKEETRDDTRATGRNGPNDANARDAISILGDKDVNTFSERWTSIQAKFVDEPQESVREADALVAEVIQSIARRFAEQKDQLEGQWSRGSDVSTEELRQALQQYRSFFQRLLSA